MQEAVSAILLGRSREPVGLNRMVTVSLAVHGAVIVLLLVLPREWFVHNVAPEESAMTISIQGVQGPDTGGLTAIAARRVQAEAAPNEKPVITPPAPKTPAMTVPDPTVKPTPVTKPIDKPADKSALRKPSTGAQVHAGDARAETRGAEVPFGGLASSSGGMGGVRTEGDFCCPEYIETMKRLIYANWDQRQGALGQTEVKFTIRRDGMIANVAVEKTSNNPLLDLESRRAVAITQSLPPLPDRFTRASLTVYLIFEYKR
jgi:TonB family protein